MKIEKKDILPPSSFLKNNFFYVLIPKLKLIGGTFMKRNFFLSLRFALVGLLAGVFTVPYQLETMSTLLGEQEIPVRLSVLILIGSIQIGVITLILSFLGLLMMNKTDLALIRQEKRNQGFKLALLFGVITGFMLVGFDRFVFQSLIPQLADYEVKFSLLALLAGVLYGGVVEEVMLRLFLMTLFIFLLTKLKKTMELPGSYYWGVIIITSLLFAIGHFPFTAVVFEGLTPALIIRSLLLNGVGGIFFGYLYWKHGLLYSIVAHMFAHISLQLIFIPLFY